jgi:hypothetical protein
MPSVHCPRCNGALLTQADEDDLRRQITSCLNCGYYVEEVSAVPTSEKPVTAFANVAQRYIELGTQIETAEKQLAGLRAARDQARQELLAARDALDAALASDVNCVRVKPQRQYRQTALTPDRLDQLRRAREVAARNRDARTVADAVPL